MITHTMLFKNSNLSLVDGRAPKREGLFCAVEAQLQSQGYVIQSKNGDKAKMEVVFIKPETLIDELEIALQNHDWTYIYRDSLGSQKTGITQVNAIRTLVQKIGDEGFQMVKRYIEDHYPNGGTYSPEFYRQK